LLIRSPVRRRYLPRPCRLPENSAIHCSSRSPKVNAASPQTLTFLFTDIEGSTPLWDSRPVAMRAATERHNALLREVIIARGGNAFRVVGDAFCVAFPDATAAVLAAVDAQRALCTQAWGDAPI